MGSEEIVYGDKVIKPLNTEIQPSLGIGTGRGLSDQR